MMNLNMGDSQFPTIVKFEDVINYIEKNGIDSIFGNFDIDVPEEEKTYAFTLLEERFQGSVMRYTDISYALMGIRRISRFAVPTLIERKKLFKELYEKEIESLRKELQQVRNRVEKYNLKQNNLDTVPIKDTSSEQETITNLSSTIQLTIEKWNFTRRNYIRDFTREYAELFSQIYSDADSIEVIGE